jgi:hypothetical protein
MPNASIIDRKWNEFIFIREWLPRLKLNPAKNEWLLETFDIEIVKKDVIK